MKKRGSDDFPFDDLAGPRKSPWNDSGEQPPAAAQQRIPQVQNPAYQQKPQQAQNPAYQQRPQQENHPVYQESVVRNAGFSNAAQEPRDNFQMKERSLASDYERRTPRPRTLNRQIQILTLISAVLLIIVLILGYFTFFPGKKSSAGSASTTAATSSPVSAVASGLPDAGASVTLASDITSGVTSAPNISVTPVATVNNDPNSLANLPPSKEHPVIALTFDDGPSPSLTPKLLEILEAKGVHVTFFMLGQMVIDADPAILKRMVADGDELGNHSYDHSIYTKLTEAQVREQLTKTNEAIFKAAGVYPTVMRPPTGGSNATVLALSKEMNLPVVNWSYESCPQDWLKANQTVDFISNYVINNAANGHIVLLHDIHSVTVDSISAMIDGLKAKGYRFATVSELLAAQPAGKQNGVLYCYGTF